MCVAYPLSYTVRVSGLASSCSHSRADARWMLHMSIRSWSWLLVLKGLQCDHQVMNITRWCFTTLRGILQLILLLFAGVYLFDLLIKIETINVHLFG